MPRRKPSAHTSHGTAADPLRRLIAGAAARLIAEDGILDYGSAKRKAARQLGAGTDDGLPSNEEVEQELRAYQAIYQDEEMEERLRDMRTTALDVMQKLNEFRPCLTGAVLDGTAARYASIELDVFADSSKDVEIMLLSNNISYQVDEIQRRGGEVAETRLQLDWNGYPVQLWVYPLVAERNHPRNAHNGRQRHRAAAPAVAALLEGAG